MISTITLKMHTELSISRFACSDHDDAFAETSSFAQDPKIQEKGRENKGENIFSTLFCLFKYYTVFQQLSAC